MREFVTPIHFEVSITHKKKEVLEPVVKWLMEDGVHDFKWDYKERALRAYGVTTLVNRMN